MPTMLSGLSTTGLATYSQSLTPAMSPLSSLRTCPGAAGRDRDSGTAAATLCHDPALLVQSDPPVATTFPVIFAQPDDLVLRPADEPETADKPVAPNDEASWHAAKPEFAKFAREMHRLCTEKIGPSSIDFSAKSYVALRRAIVAWLPMWPRANGADATSSGGPGGAVDQPNDFFAQVKEGLGPLGIEPSCKLSTTPVLTRSPFRASRASDPLGRGRKVIAARPDLDTMNGLMDQRRFDTLSAQGLAR